MHTTEPVRSAQEPAGGTVLEDTELRIAALIAVTLPLVLLYVVATVDVVRRRDLSIIRKAAWVALVVLTAYVGLAAYYLARPIQAPEGKRYDRQTPRSSAMVGELEDLHERHGSGDISDAEYLAAKRAVLGLAPDTA